MTPAALVERHRREARAVAGDFYFPGADRQDVEQEALVALWVAARAWRPGGTVPFPQFARVVIRRRLSSKLKEHARLRHRPLNESARVAVDEDGELVPVVDLLPGGRDPLDVLLERERIGVLASRIDGLTELEALTVRRMAAGFPAAGRRADNAYQRARRKLAVAA